MQDNLSAPHDNQAYLSGMINERGEDDQSGSQLTCISIDKSNNGMAEPPSGGKRSGSNRLGPWNKFRRFYQVSQARLVINP